jgi:hypothetical protein
MSLETPNTTASAARMARPIAWAAALLLFGAGMLWVPAPSQAEPYMAVREGYKCSQCHVNKTGGGARNEYANVYMQTRMSANPGTVGEGSDVGTGHVANNLSVGADVRAAFESSKFTHGSGTSSFNRDAACESCHAGAKNGVGQAGGGKLAEAFMRYQPVPDVVSIVYSVNAVPTLASRDFYGLVESVIPANGYVKAGAFKLPNGLDNTWDTPFQHAAQGGYQGLVGFETVYATGVEVGFEPGAFSFSLSATNPEAGNQAKVPTEKRYFFTASAVGRAGMIGVNYAVDPVAAKETHTLTSGFLGTSFGRVTVLGQVDRIDDAGFGVKTLSQEARLGEVDLLIARGHNLKYQIETRDPNLAKTKDTRDRQSVIYEPFLTPYLQLRVGYRAYNGPDQTVTGIKGEQWFGEAHFVF